MYTIMYTINTHERMSMVHVEEIEGSTLVLTPIVL